MPAPIPIHRRKLLRSLRRVNAALSAWDELEAMALLSPSLRGPRDRWPTIPKLDREQLKSLQAELIGALGELEARREYGTADLESPC